LKQSTAEFITQRRYISTSKNPNPPGFFCLQLNCQGTHALRRIDTRAFNVPDPRIEPHAHAHHSPTEVTGQTHKHPCFLTTLTRHAISVGCVPEIPLPIARSVWVQWANIPKKFPWLMCETGWLDLFVRRWSDWKCRSGHQITKHRGAAGVPSYLFPGTATASTSPGDPAPPRHPRYVSCLPPAYQPLAASSGPLDPATSQGPQPPVTPPLHVCPRPLPHRDSARGVLLAGAGLPPNPPSRRAVFLASCAPASMAFPEEVNARSRVTVVM